jgi:threonine synthase
MVEEQDIHAAQRQLAHGGFYVEPTSATVVAALKQVKELARPEESIVIPLTGSGLKGSPALD